MMQGMHPPHHPLLTPKWWLPVYVFVIVFAASAGFFLAQRLIEK